MVNVIKNIPDGLESSYSQYPDVETVSSLSLSQHGLVPTDGVNEIRPKDMFEEVDVPNVLRLSSKAKQWKVRFADGIYDINQSDFQLHKAPFAPGATDELLDYSQHGVTTQSDHSKGDIVVNGNSGELVTNGGFDTTDLSGWTTNSNLSVNVVNGQLEITNNSGTSQDFVYENISTQIVDYIVKVSLVTNCTVYFDQTSGTTLSVGDGTTDYVGIYTPANTNPTRIIVRVSDGATAYVDGFSWKPKEQAYIAKTNTTAGTLVTDTSKFKPIPYVTKQVALLIEKTSSGAIVNTVKPLVNMYGEESVLTYEEDIMGELGFAQKADRVWTNGSSEYILIGLKGYLNAGAYHPWFSPYGTKNFSDGKLWYNTADTVNSLYDCVVNAGTGNGRPDSKQGDFTYIEGQGGLVCFAIPNAKTPTYKHFEEAKRNLNDGYIENGFELQSFKLLNALLSGGKTYLYNCVIVKNNKIIYLPNINGYNGALGTVFSNGSDLFKIDMWVNIYQYEIVKLVDGVWTSGDYTAELNNKEKYVFCFNGSTGIKDITKSPYLVTQGKTTHTDIIGDPANYPQELKNLLAQGQGVGFCNALLVDDAGNNVIPNDTTHNTKLSKKAKVGNRGVCLDAGETNYRSVEWNSALNTSNNTILQASTYNVGDFSVVQYQAQNQSAVPVQSPQPVQAVDRNLIASNSHSIYSYNGLTYAASGKVATGEGIETKYSENIVIDENGEVVTSPKHNAITLDSNSIVASKALLTQTAKGTQVFAQELLYDSTNGNFGDTGEFEQLAPGTITDLNGHTVQTKILYKPSSIKLGDEQ